MNIENGEKDSYGDLEDSSPYIKKSNKSKQSMGSDKIIRSNKKSNKTVISIDENMDNGKEKSP